MAKTSPIAGAVALVAMVVVGQSPVAAEGAVKDSGAGGRRAGQGRQRNRDLRRRLLLGRAGRVPARQGRQERAFRLCRGHGGADPSYEQVSSESTGHAEAVKVVYDPSQVTYGKLLPEIFFSVITDPTTLDRQGNDVGSSYRSALFYHER